MTPGAGTITLLLQRARDPNDHGAREELFRLVERELRAIAAARLRQMAPGDTVQTTALIDDAFMRLLAYRRVDWEGRGQFFRIAGGVIRRILCDQLRRRLRQQKVTPLTPAQGAGLIDGRSVAPADRLQGQEMLHHLLEALDALERENPDATAVFELRVFGGRCLVLGPAAGEFTVPDPAAKLLPFAEVATILKMPRSTAFAHWSWAVTRLQSEMHAFAPPQFPGAPS